MQSNLLMSIVSITLILTSIGCTQKQANLNEAANTTINVKSEVVKVTAVTNSKSYSAVLEPKQVATIGFPIPGTVTGVYVSEGQYVRSGQELARLDDQAFSNAYQIALASSEQVVDLYNRFNELYQKGSLPERDYLDVKTKLAQARASENISAKQLNDARLKASFHGVITMKSIEKGMVVAPGQPLLTIANLDEVFAKINIPESEVGLFKKGQQAHLYIPSLQKEFNGTIDLVNPQADPVTRAFMVKVKVLNVAHEIFGGMLGDVWLKQEASEEIIIPSSAIQKGEDGVTHVYVLNGNSSSVIKKRVKVSSVRGTSDLVIDSGLEVGERIITSASARLYDGATVVQSK